MAFAVATSRKCAANFPPGEMQRLDLPVATNILSVVAGVRLAARKNLANLEKVSVRAPQLALGSFGILSFRCLRLPVKNAAL